MKLFTCNSRLNFEEYIIRVNHLAIHNTANYYRLKKGVYAASDIGLY